MTFELILDVAIGLTLTYALFSLLSSAAAEMITALFNRRGNALKFSLLRIFDDYEDVKPGTFNPIPLFRKGEGNLGKIKGVDPLGLAAAIANHPLVVRQSSGDRFPSYLSGEIIADAILDILAKALPREAISKEHFTSTLKDITNRGGAVGQAAAIVSMLAPESGIAIEEVRSRIKGFYDESMRRATGWYKRRTQYLLVFVSLPIVIAFNVNTLTIVKELSANANLREKLVTEAENIVRDPSTTVFVGLDENNRPIGVSESAAAADDMAADRARLQETIEKIDSLGLPIGWCFAELNDKSNIEPANTSPDSNEDGADARFVFSPYNRSRVDKPEHETAAKKTICNDATLPKAYSGWLGLLCGWLLSALAISLGAPFWFDTLSKLVRLRAAGAAPDHDEPGSKSASAKPVVINNEVKTDPPTTPQESASTPLSDFERENLSSDDIRDIQIKLGVDPSRVTGVLDAATRTAIKEYRTTHGMGASGEITEALAREFLGGNG